MTSSLPLSTLQNTVHQLAERLPELVWKLSTFQGVLHASQLPRGLFKETMEMTPQSCIDEINTDLNVLAKHENEISAHYLAERVSRKINVLVRLCQWHANKKANRPAKTFGIQAISTRQQWLCTLETEITRLSSQQKALLSSQAMHQTDKASIETLLKLQAEVGEVGRLLTLAQETYDRATRI